MPLQHPQLQQSLDRLASASHEIDTLLDSLDNTQLRWKPAPDSWSVGECVEHMAMTTEKLLPVLESAINEGRAAGRTAQGPFTYGWLARGFVDSLAPNTTRKYKVNKIYAPTAAPETVTDARGHWHRVHDRLGELMKAADGLDLKRIKATSPAVRLIRLPIGAWFDAMANHNERHLAQAKRVTQAPSFPQSAEA